MHDDVVDLGVAGEDAGKFVLDVTDLGTGEAVDLGGTARRRGNVEVPYHGASDDQRGG